MLNLSRSSKAKLDLFGLNLRASSVKIAHKSKPIQYLVYFLYLRFMVMFLNLKSNVNSYLYLLIHLINIIKQLQINHFILKYFHR